MNTAAQEINELVDVEANLIFGAVVDDSMSGQVRQDLVNDSSLCILNHFIAVSINLRWLFFPFNCFNNGPFLSWIQVSITLIATGFKTTEEKVGLRFLIALLLVNMNLDSKLVCFIHPLLF